MRWEPKRPEEVRTYRHDWSPFLAENDTIANSVVTPVGVTIDNESNDDTSVTITFSGGTAGTVGTIVNTITTAGGEIETEVFTVAIQSGEEPLSLSEVKRQLNIVETDTTYDSLLLGYIPRARIYVETLSGQILSQRTFVETYEEFGDFIELNHNPVNSVTTIEYIDENGDTVEYDPLNYYIRLDPLPSRIYPVDTWPTLGTNGRVIVTYEAGYAVDGSDKAQVGVQAMQILVGHWFSNREGQGEEIPPGVKALILSIWDPVV